MHSNPLLTNIRDRFLSLRSIDNLKGLDDAALMLIAENAKFRTYMPGTVIQKKDAPLEELNLVLSGTVRILRRDKLVATINDDTGGGGIGFLTLLSEDSYGIDAIADTRVSALVLPAEVVLDAFEENFSFTRNSLKLLSRQVLALRDGLPTGASEREPHLGIYRDKPMSLAEALIERRKNPVFHNTNIDAIIETVRRSREIRVEAGTKLWDIGDPSTFHLSIDYGRVRCTNADGKSAVVGGNWAIGVMDALGIQPRSHDAVTETNIVAQRLERETFLAILDSHHDLARSLQKGLALSILEANTPK